MSIAKILSLLRLFLMRKLKTAGLSNDLLEICYVTNVRSIISCATLTCFTFSSVDHVCQLECIQRRPAQIIQSDFNYESRIDLLGLPKLSDCMFN